MELLTAQSFHKMYTQKYMGFHGCNGMGYATVVINEIALFQFIFCVALFEDAFAFDYVDKLISNIFIGVDELTLFGLTYGDGYIVIYETPWRKNFQFQIMSFCDLTILSLNDNNIFIIMYQKRGNGVI